MSNTLSLESLLFDTEKDGTLYLNWIENTVEGDVYVDCIGDRYMVILVGDVSVYCALNAKEYHSNLFINKTVKELDFLDDPEFKSLFESLTGHSSIHPCTVQINVLAEEISRNPRMQQIPLSQPDFRDLVKAMEVVEFDQGLFFHALEHYRSDRKFMGMEKQYLLFKFGEDFLEEYGTFETTYNKESRVLNHQYNPKVLTLTDTKVEAYSPLEEGYMVLVNTSAVKYAIVDHKGIVMKTAIPPQEYHSAVHMNGLQFPKEPWYLEMPKVFTNNDYRDFVNGANEKQVAIYNSLVENKFHRRESSWWNNIALCIGEYQGSVCLLVREDSIDIEENSGILGVFPLTKEGYASVVASLPHLLTYLDSNDPEVDKTLPIQRWKAFYCLP